jgi:hypothetical protein
MFHGDFLLSPKFVNESGYCTNGISIGNLHAEKYGKKNSDLSYCFGFYGFCNLLTLSNQSQLLYDRPNR